MLLPLPYAGTIDLLVYTSINADTPAAWEGTACSRRHISWTGPLITALRCCYPESDPKYIQKSSEVRLRSFTTSVRSRSKHHVMTVLLNVRDMAGHAGAQSGRVCQLQGTLRHDFLILCKYDQRAWAWSRGWLRW